MRSLRIPRFFSRGAVHSSPNSSTARYAWGMVLAFGVLLGLILALLGVLLFGEDY
jgi:hypothetical protein